MTLEEAMDLLAKNCPHVFSPIALELGRLREENAELKQEIGSTQDALNEVIFNTLAGGL